MDTYTGPQTTEAYNDLQTILIVDDEELIREFLASILSRYVNIIKASSGEQALNKVQTCNPDLVILDVQMPGMNGYETCRILQDNDKTKNIPIVFITANNTNEDEEKGLEVGATDFIRKPISPKIVCTRVSNILKLHAATRKLEILALTDPLTGAYNRRHFFEAGETELKRSKRYNTTFSVMMLDIDHFKQVNDTHGHNAGDLALKETVRVISEALRKEDTLGRLGGEEFAVILPETNAEGSKLVAERIRMSIGEIKINTDVGKLMFTISIGISEVSKENENIETVLANADQGLYAAKEEGRNRVIIR